MIKITLMLQKLEQCGVDTASNEAEAAAASLWGEQRRQAGDEQRPALGKVTGKAQMYSECRQRRRF